MNRPIKLLSYLLLALMLPAGTVFAQDNLPESEKAIACMDLRLDALRNSEMAQQINLQEMFSEMMESEGPPLPIDSEKINRIFGAISLPGGVQQFMMLSPFEPLPMNFFIEFQFADSDATEAMMEDMPRDNSFEVNGNTMFVLGPDNVVAYRKSPTSLVIGTKDFLTRDYKDLFAENLKTTWAKSNNAPLRLAVDMKTRVDFLREIIAMAKAEAPPMFGPMIDVIDNAESLSLAVDLDEEDFLALRAVGIDEDNAEELRGVLDGLLGMAKMGAAQGIAEMKQQTPKMADAAEVMLNGLKASGEGREVNILLRKPEGMEELIAEGVAAARVSAKKVQKLNRFRQVCLAMHNHADAYKKFPFEPTSNPNIDKSLSWRIHLLPFLEENALYDELALDQEVTADGNAQFSAKMPELFGSDGENTDVVSIKHDRYPNFFEDIPDGTSNTIVMMEYPAGKPWMEHNDITIDEAVQVFAALEEGEQLVVAFFDGSVRNLKAGIPEETLRNLLDPKDGNVVTWDEINKWSGR